VTIKCSKCNYVNPSDTVYCGNCATPLKPADEVLVTRSEIITAPNIAKTIADKYRILGELGKGGMGTVYKAMDIRLKRSVALKFLPPELTRDEEAKERFVQEAQAASALDHPNICTIYEIDETDDNQMFISMACYEGESLKEKIDKKSLKVDEIINIVNQIAEGLAKAHKQGIIHRDIKPANIMITEDSVAKIVDFGLAKLSGQVRLTRAGTTLGTVAYMSPEQVLGEEVDHKSDIWSLGVVLYEMITGQLPFKGDQMQGVIYSILNTEPEPISSFRSDIPYHIEQVVSRFLKKDKKRRFQKAEDIVSELRTIKIGIPHREGMVHERRSGEEKRVSQKWKKLFFYGVGAIIIVLLVVGGFYLFIEKQEIIDSIAVLPFENSNEDPEMEYLCDGITESLINELSQLPSLNKVIARSSVFHYKGKKISPKKAGQELGVDAVLISWLSQHKDELSLSVELVNTADNRHIWGNQYKRKISEILDVQKEISESILENLRKAACSGIRELQRA
jgi:serine/threonine protein kinase